MRTSTSTLLLALALACASVGAAPSRRDDSINCASADDDGTALTGSAPDGTFVSCTYAGAGDCEYFSDGSFSSGGSSCPKGVAQDAPSSTTDGSASSTASTSSDDSTATTSDDPASSTTSDDDSTTTTSDDDNSTSASAPVSTPPPVSNTNTNTSKGTPTSSGPTLSGSPSPTSSGAAARMRAPGGVIALVALFFGLAL
ncbi:hypothetical protein B0H17DRAFT_1367 [Mycena rosella]|uniref:Uncharacterized protein n=1 Tax=Mycena rosella TaxID=1033263 RepID=A0AAD7H1W3_MYCRO|nr:hypothetical protein B0H17DRAFT_1367 [Mycena rosella]